VSIQTQHHAGRGAIFAFAQPPPLLRGALSVELLSPLLAALGLSAADLDARCPPTVAGEHSTRALIAVREAAMLERLTPDQAALAALSARGAPPGFFVFTLRPTAPGVLSEARMFCPALGIPEDPVSGNAHAMLAALLWRAKLLPGTAQSEFTAHQGRFMGRPGQLAVRLASDAAAGGPADLSQISVGGSAVLVFATTIALPGLAA
jgi:PhzF family phenazine biosynthesis protein